MGARRHLAAALAALCLLLPGAEAPAESVSEFVFRGEEQLLRGDLHQAAASLEQARLLQPANPRISSDLGRVYYHLARPGDAEDALKYALALDPAEAWVRCWSNLYLGKLSADGKDYPAATERLRAAAGAGEAAGCVREAEKTLACFRVLDSARERLTGTERTRNCVLHYSPTELSAPTARGAGVHLQEQLEAMARFFGFRDAGHPVEIFLHPGRSRTDLWLGREALARYAPAEIHGYYDGPGDHGPIEHELAHVLTARLTGGGGLLPLVSEGLAEWLAGDPWGLSLDGWVRGVREDGAYIPLETLASPRGFRQANPVVGYAEAGSFVGYLIATHGLSETLRAGRGGGSWAEVFGRPLAELEEAWIRTRIRPRSVDAMMAEMIRYRVWLGEFYQDFLPRGERLPWIGVRCRVTGDDVVAEAVEPTGPAAAAGLLVGDRIRSVDGLVVTPRTSWRLAGAVHRKKIGQEVSLGIEREGEKDLLTVVLGRERVDER